MRNDMSKFEINPKFVFLLLLILPSIYLYAIQNFDVVREFIYYILRQDKLVNLIWMGPLFVSAFCSGFFIADEMHEKFEKLPRAAAGVISLVLHVAVARLIYESVSPKYSEADKDLYQVFVFMISLSLPYLLYMIYELFRFKRGKDA